MNQWGRRGKTALRQVSVTGDLELADTKKKEQPWQESILLQRIGAGIITPRIKRRKKKESHEAPGYIQKRKKKKASVTSRDD